MPRGGGSSQPGLPTDYGSGGVMSSGPGTSHGHAVTVPSRMPGNGGNESKPGSLARLMPPPQRTTLPPSALMSPNDVRAMQQFLTNHGFQVAQDGILGPLTKSAAAAFRANHKGGAAWNAAHGIGVHPTVRNPSTSSPAGGSTGGATDPPSAQADPSMTAFNTLLASLLGGGGNVGSMYDPGSFGDAAAAPDVAQARALGDQIALNPKQENQNQYDISSWYGLNPNDPNYGLSVLGRLATAGSRNATAASDASSNISDIAKSLAGSIGGSANDAAANVAGAGVDDAAMFDALGQSDKQFANDMNPLLAAEARGQMSREKASNQQSLMDLRDKLALATGQEQADRATGVMSATDKNNSLAQQRFANEGNLLSTLSQLMAVDPNTNMLDDAKTAAEIKKLAAQTNAIKNPTAKVPTKVDLAQAGNSIGSLLGVGNDHKLPGDVSPTKLAYTIGSQLQALGFAKGTPEYQRYGQILISMFKDPNGNPLQVPRSWFGPGS